MSLQGLKNNILKNKVILKMLIQLIIFSNKPQIKLKLSFNYFSYEFLFQRHFKIKFSCLGLSVDHFPPVTQIYQF